MAGTLAGKFRTEKYHIAEDQLAAEMKYGRFEIHDGEENLAAGLHTVGIDTAVVRIVAGSHCVLVEADETAAADTVVLAVLVELADSAVSIGLAVVADDVELGTVDSADAAVAQGILVVAAETAAEVDDFAVYDTAEQGDCAGDVGVADTAEVAGTVVLARTVEVVDNAEAADTVAATEWQPSLTATT